MNKVIKILQLNKGDSDLSNRTDQINTIIDHHKPQLFIINELNTESNDLITRNQFPNFKLEVDNLEITDHRSRTGILIHRDIQYKRRRDLETPGTSTIWIQLNQPGRKSLLIQGIYRQFQRLGKPNTESIRAQTIRWELILQKWEKAISENKEIITLGDINLNTLRWDVSPHLKSSYEHTQAPLVQLFREQILNNGFKIINKTPTKYKNTVDSKPACSDLILTNRTDKIVSFQTGLHSFSDHTLQSVTRSTKGIVNNPKYIRTRSFKDFNVETYKNDILNHPKYIETCYEPDPETILSNIQTIIQCSLDNQSPIQTIQVKPKTNRCISSKAKEALVERDLALEEYKKTGNQDDLRNYKHLKNATNNLINTEKFKRNKDNLQCPTDNNTDRWKKLKKFTGQDKFTTPQVIVENTTHHTKHRDIANSLNRQYVTRIHKLISQMDQPTTDPIERYRKLVTPPTTTFTFTKVTMCQLKKILSNMKGTGSMGHDDISLRSIKQASSELLPLLLHLLNRTISTTTFPTLLKISKVVPIKKIGKDVTTAEGWRPINVLSAISKVLEQVFLIQISAHIDQNNLIGPNHHGAVRHRSTQTLITDLHDQLLEETSKGNEKVLLIIDQSKAYDVVPHNILL